MNHPVNTASDTTRPSHWPWAGFAFLCGLFFGLYLITTGLAYTGVAHKNGPEIYFWIAVSPFPSDNNLAALGFLFWPVLSSLAVLSRKPVFRWLFLAGMVTHFAGIGWAFRELPSEWSYVQRSNPLGFLIPYGAGQIALWWTFFKNQKRWIERIKIAGEPYIDWKWFGWTIVPGLLLGLSFPPFSIVLLYDGMKPDSFLLVFPYTSLIGMNPVGIIVGLVQFPLYGLVWYRALTKNWSRTIPSLLLAPHILVLFSFLIFS